MLVTCAIFGYIGRKAKVITDSTDSAMSTLIVKFTLPSLILVSLLRPFSSELLWESVITFVIMVAIYLAGFLLGVLVSKIMRNKSPSKNIWQFALTFPNVAYLGFPVIQAVFGDEGMIYATMASVAFNLMLFSLGVYVMQRQRHSRVSPIDVPQDEVSVSKPDTVLSTIKNIVLAPAILAAFIGFVLFVTGLRPPSPMLNGVRLIGNMTTPLAMLVIGSVLAKTKLLSIVTDLKVYPIVFLRLLGIPLLAFFSLRWFIHNPVMLGTIVVLVAMPSATLTVIFSEQYGSDTATAVKIVALTNILCLATIPLLSLLIM
ncbi:MAG: AEC family transporter [Defluviitaleaceae bacterium]|nr:AEC family transporter [Defluviitaleaceae bacterium]